jgi:hypothetical protein
MKDSVYGLLNQGIITEAVARSVLSSGATSDEENSAPINSRQTGNPGVKPVHSGF